AEVEHAALFRQCTPSRGTRNAGRMLHACCRKDRDQHGEGEVAGERECDDRAVAGVKVHADASATGVAGAAASPRRGRIAQRLTANTRWLATISIPPTVLQSHNGAAASTDRMNASPATQEKPWRTPAIVIDTT